MRLTGCEDGNRSNYQIEDTSIKPLTLTFISG